MLTAKQIERWLDSADFGRLARELLAGRAELSARTLLDCSKKVPCAALTLIRLDELTQSHVPLAGKVIHILLSSQEADGGWGDAPTTALVLRALSTARGHGQAMSRGLAYLAALQKEDGLFPLIPIRRAEADELASSLVLHHLTFVPSAATSVDLFALNRAVSRVRNPALPALRRAGPSSASHHPSPHEDSLFRRGRFALAS
jgi:hypothetical protein